MIADNTNGLPRFCHPYHGGWDVARIALDIPESRILFVCPISCARIICLNAIKYDYSDRIDVLALTEEDIVSGNYEEKTVEAACEVLSHSQPRPKALILYVSCIDAMLGNDHSFQTEEIMRRFPDVNCFVLKMCPITRFSGDLPLVALQHDMYKALPAVAAPKEKIVAFIGTNIAFDPQCELIRLLTGNGYRPLHIQACEHYEDYLVVRSSALNLGVMPFALSACRMLNERYRTPFLPFFLRYDFASIRSTLSSITEALSLPPLDLDEMEAETRSYLKECAEKIRGTELVIDSSAALFPDALRETLASCGFQIRRVYADDVSRTLPDIDSGYLSMPWTRSYQGAENVIAIGMVSSSLEGATMTVNQFYDNGEWGFYGLKKLGERIVSAYNNPKSAMQLKTEERK